MGIGSSDLHVRSLAEPDAIVRVERESGTNDFGKKESHAGQGKNKPGGEDEEPGGDQVELSEEYLSEHDTELEAPAAQGPASAVEAGADKRLDIEA